MLPANPVARHAAALAHLGRWKLTGSRYDADRVPPGLPSRFVSARAAAALVDDFAVGLSCGMAAFHPSSILYWALRDRFLQTGRPRNLTWCGVGGLGGRGRASGTLEELGLPGLVTRAILGHTETVHSFLQLAEAGQLELHTLPQGQYTRLVEAQGDGVRTISSPVGTGTFLDPRVGQGSRVSRGAREQYVEADGDGLRYRLPALDVFFVNAPFADRDGNLYARGAACLTEIHDGARAVHANGGTVIACVSDVLDPAAGDAVHVPAAWVDAIVVDPQNPQLLSVPQRRAWPAFSPGPGVDTAAAEADTRAINVIARAAPRRSSVDAALARAAASLVADELPDRALVNVGTGFPEEVGRVLHATLGSQLTLSAETGVVGGMPTSGLFFGAAISPLEQLRSSEIFRRYETELDLTCVGMLEVDSGGNVNVSRRGPATTEHVGPGGFPDITHHARTVVFVGSFAVGERLRMDGGRLQIRKPGRSKFVDRVREVTFNGRAALERGQRVLYITHRCAMRLTPDGLELTHVAPGVDVEREVLASPARIRRPDAELEVLALR